MDAVCGFLASAPLLSVAQTVQSAAVTQPNLLLNSQPRELVAIGLRRELHLHRLEICVFVQPSTGKILASKPGNYSSVLNFLATGEVVRPDRPPPYTHQISDNGSETTAGTQRRTRSPLERRSCSRLHVLRWRYGS